MQVWRRILSTQDELRTSRTQCLRGASAEVSQPPGLPGGFTLSVYGVGGGETYSVSPIVFELKLTDPTVNPRMEPESPVST